MPIPEYFTLCC